MVSLAVVLSYHSMHIHSRLQKDEDSTTTQQHTSSFRVQGASANSILASARTHSAHQDHYLRQAARRIAMGHA